MGYEEERRELSVGSVINAAIENFKNHWIPLVCLVFVIEVLTSIGNFVRGMGQGMSNSDSDAVIITAFITLLLGFTLSLVGGLAASYLQCGLFRILRSIADGEDYDTMEKLKVSFLQWLKYFGINLLLGLVLAVAFLCCILPGIFLGVRLLFVPMLVANHPEMSLGQVLKRSWEMTEGNFFTLLAIGLITIPIVLVGILLCCVGIFPAAAITNLMLAECYKTLGGNEAYKEEVYE